MTLPTLDYRSPMPETHARRRGDWIVVGVVVAFAGLNLLYFLMLREGLFGSAGLEVFHLPLFFNALGVIAAFPVQWILSPCGVSWRGGLAAVLCFLAMLFVNLLFLAEAIASC